MCFIDGTPHKYSITQHNTPQKHSTICVLPLNVSDGVLDPYNSDKIMVLCIIIFKLSCSRR
jgi:hypothetical protein